MMPSNMLIQLRLNKHGTMEVKCCNSRRTRLTKTEMYSLEALDYYHTAFVGKWHVGGMGADGYQPHDRGFDEVRIF